MSRGTIDFGNVKGPKGDQGVQGPAGPQGVPGPAGPRGYGVPDGGTNNQVLVKDGSVDYRAKWMNDSALPGMAGKKSVQTAVTDPTSSGTAIHFISGITQNAQGVITPVKKQVRILQGSTATAAGDTGLVPVPAAGQSDRYLRCDGSWAVPPNDNTEYDVFTGATSEEDGTTGLVPAPESNLTLTTSFLSAEGEWKSLKGVLLLYTSEFITTVTWSAGSSHMATFPIANIGYPDQSYYFLGLVRLYVNGHESTVGLIPSAVRPRDRRDYATYAQDVQMTIKNDVEVSSGSTITAVFLYAKKDYVHTMYRPGGD